MTKQKLELFYFPSCPYCQLVLRQIDYLEIDVELKNIQENPEYKKFHIEKTGRKTVPCLYIDGEPLFESSDIINFLKKQNK